MGTRNIFLGLKIPLTASGVEAKKERNCIAAQQEGVYLYSTNSLTQVEVAVCVNRIRKICCLNDVTPDRVSVSVSWTGRSVLGGTGG